MTSEIFQYIDCPDHPGESFDFFCGSVLLLLKKLPTGGGKVLPKQGCSVKKLEGKIASQCPSLAVLPPNVFSHAFVSIFSCTVDI
jgi:hypothetical protein